ncbi:MAG: adenylyl-sulfate kinase [Betaproteobacteria bacterium]
MTTPATLPSPAARATLPTAELAARLWRLLAPRDRRRLALALALAALTALLEAAAVGLVPLFVLVLQSPQRVAEAGARWLGADWMPAGDRMLVVAASALVIAYAAKTALGLGSLAFQTRYLREQQDALTARLLRAYAFAPYAVHLGRSSSDMVRAVLGETGVVVSSMLMSMFAIFAELCVAALVGMLIVAVQPGMALGTIAAFALMSWAFYRGVRGRVARLSRENQDHGRKALSWVTQTLVGIKEVRVSGREEYFLAHARRHAGGSNAASQAINFMNAVPRYFNEGVAVVAMVGLAFALMASVPGGDPAAVVPVLVLFAVAAMRIIPSFNRIVSAVTLFRYGEAALRSVDGELRALELLEASGQAPAAPGAVAAPFESLEVAGLRFAYGGKERFELEVRGLRIRRGERVAFVGPSGSGKTTLMDLLLGLHPSPAGAVRVNGRDLGDLLPAWRANVGYVPQSVFLLDDTLRRNVAFGLPDDRIDDARVLAALAAARLESLVAAMPGGIDAEVGDRGVRLSGGQRQRIGIARALYRDPEVLILDEGTAALDNVTEAEVVRAIDGLAGRKTVITIAHRLSTVERCDRIYFMREGRILAAGSFAELRDRVPEFQAMLHAGGASGRAAPEAAAPPPGPAPASRNITWQPGKVAPEARERVLGQKPVTFWLTGLSASGKSTLAFELERRVLAAGRACYVLDGDNLRHGLNRDLGFSPEARAENIRRVAEVARLFNDAGIIVVTAFISPYRADRELVRQLVGPERFAEIFVDAPLEVCERRDPRGLYARARSGAISEFTGVSAPYEVPEAPELHLHTDQMDAASASALLYDFVAGRCFGSR